ncbi:cell envelope biogenesis protein TolA [Azorhizobium sp. AG788]|uniref:cell envelope biogenesis protein TolA n=1 Tax=Azorhizobium sp. AG788 TaxID=2183897 RepID=UPI003139707F
MRAGLTASTLVHGGVIVLALVSFAAPSPFDAPPPESINVDVISASELSQMTKGNEKGKKTETKKLVAEKVDAPKPVNDPNLKVSEKAEVEPATQPPPPPPPPPPTPTPKPEDAKPTPPTPKVEDPKPAPTPPKAERPPEPKVEPKADEALKADPKKEDQKQEAKVTPPPPPPLPPKKPAPPPLDPPKTTADAKPDQKLDYDKIAALLDKRTPQRNAAADQAVSQTASLGAPRGEAQTLSQSEIDALRARIQSCWSPPAGASEASDLRAAVSVSFKPDGSLAVQPLLAGVTPASSPYGPAFADSALRAIIRCAPYSFLPANKYNVWKDIELGFSLRDMLGRSDQTRRTQ